MNVKRILSRLRLDKIASVDRPCQEGATVALIKQASDYDALVKAKYDTADRKDMASSGAAMSDGSYPIKDAEDLHNAIHAVGRGRNNSHAAIRRHIISRAKSLGLSDEIPDTWKDGGNLAKSLLDVFEKAAIPLDDPDGFEKGAEAFETILGETELSKKFWSDWHKGTEALQKSLSSIIEDNDVEKAAEVEKSLKQFADYIEQILPGDIGKAIAAGIVASAGQAGTPLNKGDVMSVALMKALGLSETASEADVLKAIADRNDELKKTQDELEKAKAKAPPAGDNDGDEDDMQKMLKSGDAFRTPEGAVITKKAVGEGVYGVLKSQNDRILKQEEEIKKAREAEEERSFQKRAEELGCAPEFGSTLRKAYNGDKDAQAELEKQIQGLNKQVDEGQLFANFGKSGEAGTATAEFTAKVEEVKKADPKLTDPQAYTKVYTDRANRDLVKRMNDEQRQQAA